MVLSDHEGPSSQLCLVVQISISAVGAWADSPQFFSNAIIAKLHNLLQPLAMDLTVSSVERKEQLLSALLEKIDIANNACDSARDALTAAAARLEEAETLVLQLGQDARALRATIDDERHALNLRRAQVASIPPELLRAIFLSTIPEHWHLWKELGAGQFSYLEAAKPFALAAVCSRWRKVACTTPQLWTYLGVPVPKSPIHALHQLQRVEVVIRRSKSHPIEVLLPWASCLDSRFTSDPCTGHIFTEITAAIHRWRVFEFNMPQAALSVRALERFRYPAPKLEQLVLIGPGSDDQEDLPEVFSEAENQNPRRYFPICPLLSVYRSTDTNVFINAAAPIKPLSRLGLMNITVGNTAIRWLWDALRAAPELRVLYVETHHGQHDYSDHIPVPSSELQFSLLEELSVDETTGRWFSAASALLRMPSLVKYIGSCATLDVLGQSFFDGPGKGITTIHIDTDYDNELGAEDSAHFGLVPSAEALELTGVSIDGAFFEELLAPDDAGLWLLPRLSRLQLLRCLEGQDALLGERLIQFLHARTLEREDGAPARLVTVNIDKNSELSDFHFAEIKHIIKSDEGSNTAKVLGEVDTGDMLLGVEKVSGWEGEDEAVMTDQDAEEDETSDSDTSTDSEAPGGRYKALYKINLDDSDSDDDSDDDVNYVPPHV